MSNNDLGIGAGFIGFMVLFYVVVIVVAIIANWQVWSKAGYNGAWSLLLLIPIVNIIAFLYLAFSDWPVRQRLRQLEGGGSGGPSV